MRREGDCEQETLMSQHNETGKQHFPLRFPLVASINVQAQPIPYCLWLEVAFGFAVSGNGSVT
jgi:hypothetical protein